MEQPTNTFEALAPRKRSSSSLVLIVLIILVVILGWWFLGGRNKTGLFTNPSISSDYQAVFLTNNQVYFGKLTRSNDDYAVLTDIFYLQVDQPLQPSQPASPAGGPNPNVSLIKLGSELHGPADRMEINRDQILFIENLRPDSQVVKGIEKYKSDQKSQP